MNITISSDDLSVNPEVYMYIDGKLAVKIDWPQGHDVDTSKFQVLRDSGGWIDIEEGE